jgi:hypothetical protein
LPLALAESNKYLAGIPEGGLPKIKNNKVMSQKCHPLRWSDEVVRKMKENLEAGKLEVLQRPPGRIVLFEVEDRDFKYDTTLAFSQNWLVAHINDPSLRNGSKMVPGRQKKARSKMSLSRASGKRGTRYQQPKPLPIPKEISTRERTKGLEEKAQFLEDSKKGAANAMAVMRMLGFGHSSTNTKASNGSRISTQRSSQSLSARPKQSANVFETSIPILPAEHPRRALKIKRRRSDLGHVTGRGSYMHLARADSVDDTNIDAYSQSLSPKPEGSLGISFAPDINWKIGDVKSNAWPPLGYPRHVGPDVSRASLLDLLTIFFSALSTSSVSVCS